MAINTRALADIQLDVANATTTEANFRRGQNDIAVEVDSLNTRLTNSSLDSIESLDASVTPSDLNLLGGLSSTPNAVTKEQLQELSVLVPAMSQLEFTNGLNAGLVADEVNILDGILADNPNSTPANATLATADLIKLAGWNGSTSDLDKLTAISATADQINILTSLTDTNADGTPDLTAPELDTLNGIDTTTTIQAQINAIEALDPVLTLTGDVTGTATFTNLGNASLATTIAANSVALGTDTTGNYMVNVQGTTNEITVTHTQGEGSTATISLPATINANTTGSAATLTTARNIGGVSFNGSANINLPGVNAVGNQNTTGSAATWTTGRTITLTGDVTGTSGTFNGSGNLSFATSLAANSVGSAEIANDAVGSSEIATDAVGTDALDSDAVVVVRAETGSAPSVADFAGAVFVAEYV